MARDLDTVAAWATEAPADEILERIGRELIGDGAGFGPKDLDRGLQFARDWFDARASEFRAAVCSSDVLVSLGGDLSADLLVIAPLLLVALDENNLLAALVGALILKRGIAMFCDFGS